LFSHLSACKDSDLFCAFLDFNSLIISIVSIEINFKILGLNRQILWKQSS
jgi:hypothetical protein